MRPLLAAMLAIFASMALAQSAYRWVDKSGKVHYSDEPPPPSEVRSVESKRLQGNVSGGAADYTFEARRAAEDFPVIIFTAANCSTACNDGRNLLTRRGVPFNETEVKTPEDAAAFKAATGLDKLSVPTLVVGRKTQIGYEVGLWNDLLDSAGYPKSTTRRTTAPAAPAPKAP